jgi:hypothetical protein
MENLKLTDEEVQLIQERRKQKATEEARRVLHQEILRLAYSYAQWEDPFLQKDEGKGTYKDYLVLNPYTPVPQSQVAFAIKTFGLHEYMISNMVEEVLEVSLSLVGLE